MMALFYIIIHQDAHVRGYKSVDVAEGSACAYSKIIKGAQTGQIYCVGY